MVGGDNLDSRAFITTHAFYKYDIIDQVHHYFQLVCSVLILEHPNWWSPHLISFEFNIDSSAMIVDVFACPPH